jgi:hypothetical protein
VQVIGRCIQHLHKTHNINSFRILSGLMTLKVSLISSSYQLALGNTDSSKFHLCEAIKVSWKVYPTNILSETLLRCATLHLTDPEVHEVNTTYNVFMFEASYIVPTDTRFTC